MLWHYPFKMHKKCVGFHGNALLSLCLSVSVSLSLVDDSDGWWLVGYGFGFMDSHDQRGQGPPPPLAWSVAVFLCLFMHSNWTIPRGDCNYNTIITRAKRVQLQRYNISIFEMMFQKNCKQVLLFSYSFVFFS